jgi:hypothetical protein
MRSIGTKSHDKDRRAVDGVRADVSRRWRREGTVVEVELLDVAGEDLAGSRRSSHLWERLYDVA